MRLTPTFFVTPVFGSFYSEYNLFNSPGRFGSSYTAFEFDKEAANGKYCHSTQNKLIFRWDRSKFGYFRDFERVQCVGEEFYCFIEERAHFGQVIGIKAGCAQMASHPQVEPPSYQAGLWNNREPGRGRSFTNSGSNTAVHVYYGVGGCMAMPAQNQPDHLDSSVNTFNSNNYRQNSSLRQAQCLRLEINDTQKNLLPFGVSVCRACCLAGTDSETDYSADTKAPCNFLPFSASAGVPALPSYDEFDCHTDIERSNACTSDTNCHWCEKELVPRLEMISYDSEGTPVNLFSNNCESTPCTPVAHTITQIPIIPIVNPDHCFDNMGNGLFEGEIVVDGDTSCECLPDTTIECTTIVRPDHCFDSLGNGRYEGETFVDGDADCECMPNMSIQCVQIVSN